MLNHGINVLESNETLGTVTETASGITAVFGTAPVHLTSDPDAVVNRPVVVRSFGEAKEKLGYSTDYGKYTLCQAMKMSLDVFGVAPVVFVNVLDPGKHARDFDGQVIDVVNRQAVLSMEGVLLSSLAVSSGEGMLEEDRDYVLSRKGELVTITLVGTAAETATSVTVGGRCLDPSLVTGLDVIGGYDAETGKESGLELIRMVYPMFGFTAALMAAPGYSHIPEVAAAMEAKCEDINGCFRCECVVDLDPARVRKYSDVTEGREELGACSYHTYAVWPMARVDGLQVYGSAVVAALTQYTDSRNGDMANLSPSNRDARIDAAVLKDGTEILPDFVMANAVNDAGVGTFINLNGWKLFGNATVAYQADSGRTGKDLTEEDVKKSFWSIRRFFTWRANRFITDYVSRLDGMANRKLLESICDAENMRCNALVSMGVCAAASISFPAEDNTDESIASGELNFRQSYAPFVPAQKITNTLSLDIESMQSALTGGE